MIELKILERAEVEFKKTRAFMEGHIQEYIGHEYIQDETIVGNSDKIAFYMKDMVSQLTKSQKQNINPFLIGKLDIETINFFEFPSLTKDVHPFKRSKPQLNENWEIINKISNE